MIATKPPWLQEATTVATAMGADIEHGLTHAEAATRLARDGPNSLTVAMPIPAWRKLLAQFASPLIYLLLAAVIVSLAAWLIEGAESVPFDAIVILVIVLLNAILGFVQEARAEQAVAALQRMAAITVGVMRSGRAERIPVADVVPGDLLLLEEGDAVSADARLVQVASLTVAEAPLTGESAAVVKHTAPLDGPAGVGDRLNMVFSGTAVTRGRGRAVVTATGVATELGAIARLLESTTTVRTPLQRETDRIGKLLGLAVICITAIVVSAILLTSGLEELSDFVEVMLVGVSLAVAAVPEGLPAVLSIVLALGVQRMARQNAIVKQLPSVETLGSASVICSDKTGTLTRNEMTVTRIITASGEIDVTGSGYQSTGRLQFEGQPLGESPLLDEARELLVGGSLANDAALHTGDGGWSSRGDPTDIAFLVAEAKVEGLTAARTTRYTRVGEVPFSSDRKLMSALETDSEHAQAVTVFTKGAPDVLLTRCIHERIAGQDHPLTDSRRQELLATVDRLADQALRPLAVACRTLPAGQQPANDEALETELTYLGMVGIIDPARPEARAAIAEAAGAGVRIIMITGDHPRTAVRIAEDLGIVAAGAQPMTGAEIEELDDDSLHAAVRDVSIYARVDPEHKLRIVSALRANGHVVAMTGDGVNDAPALKSADIGIAMGITGTDVSKEAADMILADDNFATIVSAIREGRAIFANIRKFLRFLLSSNIGEVLTMFFGVMLAGLLGLRATGESVAVPLLATQILWINLLTDTAPALAMGVDPGQDDVMRSPPRKLTDRVIDREMWFGVFFVGIVMAAVTLLVLDLRLAGGLFGGSGEIDEARTMAFTTLVFAQLFNCFNARSDRASAFRHLFTNRLLWGAVALSATLQFIVVQIPVFNDAFGTTALPLTDWLLCIALASIVLWANELRKLLQRWLRR